ncbi:D-alanyl-D-alanine carboxypeptidase family protein [Virgibacillus proomii]|uniref:D-alanyl-D-alanine carboxypeptidase family protein n=1 Tax=Virgibacillus proomii TaxID=84407 RepID=UPI001C106461|nr:D-alanyl-D-alanine carboxypeptidase family protein [Virgibacillus proomii]MBU5266159.1 D-alanyl-D-alanine carboxypeptidase family protein [Virgibacillus proomii]
MKRKHIIRFIVLLFVFVFTTACADTDKQSAKEEQNGSEEKNVQLPDGELQKLDSGQDVEALQQVLKKIGYHIDSNGKFDAATVWAITDLQLQHDLPVTGIYSQETAEMIEQLLAKDSSNYQPGKALPAKAEPVTTNGGVNVLANPHEQLALVNKENALPEDYIPVDLVTPSVPFPFKEDLPKKKMRDIAAPALEELFAAAEKEGLELYAQSGYRSYDRQVTVFNSNVQSLGEKEANLVSARPGESEHQTGLTMDVTSPAINFDLTTEFADTDEGKWLADHAADYGFIIRFPKGKEDITKYQYEPWHIRYVGKKAAKEIMENNLTLEEYLTK